MDNSVRSLSPEYSYYVESVPSSAFRTYTARSEASKGQMKKNLSCENF